MSKDILTVEQFMKEVKDHKMEVRQENGLYRHLLFRAPKDSCNLWFEIVTWPRSLAINGDMGSWSFSRGEDMFDLFRDAQLRINPSYWAERITSESRFEGPHEKFHAETFKANVLGSLDGYGLDAKESKEIASALQEEVFCESDESSCRRALEGFRHGDFQFSKSWEISGNRYTYHFIWCLYAIVWAIGQYDASRMQAEVMPCGNTR